MQNPAHHDPWESHAAAGDGAQGYFAGSTGNVRLTVRRHTPQAKNGGQDADYQAGPRLLSRRHTR